MQGLVDVLQANGGDMAFPAFVQAATVAGQRPQLWLKAKHAGMVETYFDENGAHRIRLPQQQPTP